MHRINLTSFGTEKQDCMRNTRDIFNLLHLINSYLIMVEKFLLAIISAIMSPDTIKYFLILVGLYSLTLL